MRILRMTATFGCLDGAVLEPTEGLNAFLMPNESGKSTWSAFLTAMFYGVETTQRAAKGRVPDKLRYQPWSGKPMSGTMELERDGQVLVLQRTSERGRPMAVFRAWDRDTGLDIPGLTAENCGRKLLGVERAVFRRSAFLSGTELAVTQDQDLARRLGALAAAGRESDSYPQAEQKLKLWQNRCRYHKTGRIPETEEQLEKTRALLEEAEELRRQRLLLIARLEQQRKQVKTMERQQRRQREQQEQQLRQQLEQAHAEAEQWAAKTASLPSEQELRQMQVRLGKLTPETGAEPNCPPALQGLTAEQIWPKAQRDLAEHDRLAALTPKKDLPYLFCAAAALVFSAAAVWLRIWWLLLLLLGMAGFCCFRWYQQLRYNRQVQEAAQTIASILDSYGVTNGEALLRAAMTRRDWLLAVERAERQAWEAAVLLEEIRGFAPEVQTPQDGEAAVLQALRQLEQTREAKRTLERVRMQWENRAVAGNDDETERLRRQLIRMEAEKDGLLRQEQALGSWEELQNRAQALEETLNDLTKRERALMLAREALASANGQLAQVYAPQVTRLAAAYLGALTQGRYDGLLLEPDLTLSVREAASGLVRQLSMLSRGTQDQVWLALRLSMTQLLLPADTPIVLDDALLTFDREREQAALAVLRNESRQVLLFTCR